MKLDPSQQMYRHARRCYRAAFFGIGPQSFAQHLAEVAWFSVPAEFRRAVAHVAFGDELRFSLHVRLVFHRAGLRRALNS